jgi:hypothetical protein
MASGYLAPFIPSSHHAATLASAEENEMAQTARVGATSVQTYARTAGVLFLISAVAGGLGEFFVPSLLVVSGDATATANNIVASESLFRLGLAGYVVEGLCDVALTLVLYVLLRPVHPNVALLAVFFRLVSTAVFGIAEVLFYSGPLLILSGADHLKTFSPEQLNTLAYLTIRLFGYGSGIAFVFYGVGSLIFGYLIYRSGYLPRLIGVLLAISGLGFVIRTFLLVLAPAYATSALLLPTAVAGLALTAWLLVKGVDEAKWKRTVELRGVEPLTS